MRQRCFYFSNKKPKEVVVALINALLALRIKSSRCFYQIEKNKTANRRKIDSIL